MQTKILVIENDSFLAEKILLNLKSFQYQVLPVVSRSEEVVDRLKIENPDLIILDLEFQGGMDGISLAEIVRQQSDKPMIFVTEKSENLTLSKVHSTNPYGFVLKDFDPYRFSVVITIALQKYNSERRLRESEDRLRMISNLTYDWEYWMDEMGQFVYISPSVERVTGYTQAEFMRNPDLLHHIAHPQDQEHSREHSIQRKRNLGITDFKLRIVKKDGSIRWLQHICQPVIGENGGVYGHYATNHDITEQQMAEFTLAESEKRYRSMFEDSSISLWEEDFSEAKKFIDDLRDQGIKDISAYFCDHPDQFKECVSKVKVLDINKAGLTMYKARDKESLIKRANRIFQKADPHLIIDELQALADGAMSYDGEGVNRDLEGNSMDVQIHWSVPPDSQNKYSRVLVSIIDVTNRRNRERSLEVISTVSAAVRTAKTRQEMLQVIDDQITRLFNTSGWAVALVDEEKVCCTIERASGKWKSLTGYKLDKIDLVFQKFFSDDQPVVLKRGDRFPSGLSFEIDFPAMDRIICPLIAEEQILGAMMVGWDSPITENVCNILHSLSNILAVALYRTNLLERTRLFADHMAAISTMGRRLTQTLNLNEVYEYFGEGVRQFCPDVTTVFISSYDIDTKTHTCDYGLFGGRRLENSQLPSFQPGTPDHGPLSDVINTRQPLIIDCYDDNFLQIIESSLTSFEKGRIKSGVYIPLIVKDEILGVLQLQSARTNRFSQSDVDLLIPLASTGAIAIKNSRLFSETQIRLKRLTTLRTIDLAISSNLDLKVMMNILIHELMSFLEFKAVDILLYDPGRRLLEFCAGRGFDDPVLENLSVKLGEGMAGKAALEGRMVIYAPSKNGEYTDLPGVFYSPNVHKSYVAVPMISKGQVKGVIEAYFADRKHLSTEWLQFLETLAGQVAIALDNNELVSELTRSNLELMMAYDSTLEGWSKALDLRDHETEGHSHRVMELTVELAGALGLRDDEIQHIRRGALLHDIGKMGIPDNILLKEGPLTDEEWVVMRKHPVYAFEMLSTISYLSQSLDIPYCHHEHWDGRGYPRGLKGEQIPLAARIFAVVDVYDSLVSDRPYRKAWSKEKALRQIEIEAATHLDAVAVEKFLGIMK
jgi:PAS domain S-box-containing protein